HRERSRDAGDGAREHAAFRRRRRDVAIDLEPEGEMPGDGFHGIPAVPPLGRHADAVAGSNRVPTARTPSSSTRNAAPCSTHLPSGKRAPRRGSASERREPQGRTRAGGWTEAAAAGRHWPVAPPPNLPRPSRHGGGAPWTGALTPDPARGLPKAL